MATAMLAGRRCSSLPRRLLPTTTTTTTTILRRHQLHHLIPSSFAAAAPLTITTTTISRRQQHHLLVPFSSFAAAGAPLVADALRARTFTSSGGGGGGGGGEGDSDDHHKAQRHRNNKKNTERLGEFKSPIVTQLWSRRSSPAKGGGLEIDAVNTTTPPVKRPPSHSRTEVVYDFTKDSFLRQSYENPWGFFRKGKLLEDMDALAVRFVCFCVFLCAFEGLGAASHRQF
jgi:hypothetical protein